MEREAARYPYPAAIEAYGNGGFRFAGMSHRGSILCLPTGIHAWAAVDAGQLDAEDAASILADLAPPTVLLLGAGRPMVLPPQGFRDLFAARGIALEVMDTGAACRTFTVLLGEGRPVAAALIAVP